MVIVQIFPLHPVQMHLEEKLIQQDLNGVTPNCSKHKNGFNNTLLIQEKKKINY